MERHGLLANALNGAWLDICLIAVKLAVGAAASWRAMESIVSSKSSSSTHCQIRPHAAACSALSFSARQARPSARARTSGE
jgi:hypothetical protein